MSIAYLDCEYNCGPGDNKDLIEVGIVIVGKRGKELDRFESFVKPTKRKGRLFKTIIDYTGIKQSDVDNGISVKRAFERIDALLLKYDVTRIYVYGGDDIPALKENSRLYDDSIGAKHVISLVRDQEPEIRKAIGSKFSINLGSLAKACGYTPGCAHRALDDAITLFQVDRRVKAAQFDIALIKKFNAYNEAKASYRRLITLGNIYPEIMEAMKKADFKEPITLTMDWNVGEEERN